MIRKVASVTTNVPGATTTVLMTGLTSSKVAAKTTHFALPSCEPLLVTILLSLSQLLLLSAAPEIVAIEELVLQSFACQSYITVSIIQHRLLVYYCCCHGRFDSSTSI